MKKGVSFIWDGACQHVFENIKRYLTNPVGEIISYICGGMDNVFGTLLVQKNKQVYEQAIYYLSRTIIQAEHRYNLVEKEFSFSVCSLEDVTISNEPDNSCHLQCQPIELAHGKIRFTK